MPLVRRESILMTWTPEQVEAMEDEAMEAAVLEAESRPRTEYVPPMVADEKGDEDGS